MKLTESQLRRIIRNETRSMLLESPRRHRNSLTSLIFEEDEKKDSGSEKSGEDLSQSLTLGGKPLGKPTGTKFTDQTNFADFTDPESCREVFAQLATADGSQSIYQAMGGKSDPKKVAEWLKGFGPELDELANRVVAIGKKLPASGLPKDKMPFLPGPPDAKGTVDQVEDALTPGGDLNVDFKESRRRLTRGSSVIVERWQKLAGIITEKVDAPAPNTFSSMEDEKAKEYMTSGLNDGKPDDDKATIKLNPEINAAEAIPTQKNVLLPKTIGMAASGIKGGPIGAYFSTNNEILDGHHRWSATMLNDPQAKIGGFAAIDLDAMGGREEALKHLTAIGNALGNATKTK